jgi:hypothetical protein
MPFLASLKLLACVWPEPGCHLAFDSQCCNLLVSIQWNETISPKLSYLWCLARKLLYLVNTSGKCYACIHDPKSRHIASHLGHIEVIVRVSVLDRSELPLSGVW